MSLAHRSRSLLLGFGLSGMLVLAACGSPQAAGQAGTATPAPKAAPASPVAADTARRGDIQQSLAYSGDIRAREQISVLPKASGRVEKVLVDIGTRVKAGDTLADRKSVV